MMALDMVHHDSRITLLEGRIRDIEWILSTSDDTFFGREDLLKERADFQMYLTRIVNLDRNRRTGITTEEGSMNIIFEEPETHAPTFSMVDEGQLFVGEDACLYQRANNVEGDEEARSQAWMISDEDGLPRGELITFYHSEDISRILPKIKRINV